MPLITLTTDFGVRDWFVGTMNGVVARIAGATPVIDITHGIDQPPRESGAKSSISIATAMPSPTFRVALRACSRVELA